MEGCTVKIKLLILLVVLTAGLSACSPPKPFDFSLNNVPVSRTKFPYRLTSVAVNVETRDDPTGDKYGSRPPGLEKFAEPLKSSVEDALNKSAIFSYESHKFCSLDIKILGIKYERMGIHFPVTLYARYSVIDLDSGKPVFNKVIIGHGSTPAGYNFFGAVRSRHSLILSGRSNVRNFIQVLEHFVMKNYSVENTGEEFMHPES